MTQKPPIDDPDTSPYRPVRVGDERKRAAIALAALAVAAVVLVAIMIVAFGNSEAGRTAGGDPTVQPSGPAVLVTGATSSRSTTGPSPRPDPSTSSTRPTRSGPRRGPVSCPGQDPCTQPDDVGDVLGAINDYRGAHGQAAITGRVTQTARTCAITHGDQCPQNYFWQPVGRSGAEVVQKIAAAGDGVGWLLDPRMTRVQIGWAYDPASGGFECAVISNS